MAEGLFSVLSYCKCGINQYAVQKTLTASLLLLELIFFTAITFTNSSSCFDKNIKHS